MWPPRIVPPQGRVSVGVFSTIFGFLGPQVTFPVLQKHVCVRSLANLRDLFSHNSSDDSHLPSLAKDIGILEGLIPDKETSVMLLVSQRSRVVSAQRSLENLDDSFIFKVSRLYDLAPQKHECSPIGLEISED